MNKTATKGVTRLKAKKEGRIKRAKLLRGRGVSFGGSEEILLQQAKGR